ATRVSRRLILPFLAVVRSPLPQTSRRSESVGLSGRSGWIYVLVARGISTRQKGRKLIAVWKFGLLCSSPECKEKGCPSPGCDPADIRRHCRLHDPHILPGQRRIPGYASVLCRRLKAPKIATASRRSKPIPLSSIEITHSARLVRRMNLRGLARLSVFDSIPHQVLKELGDVPPTYPVVWASDRESQRRRFQ
ncbi:MAG: hypothetical protein QOJ99_5287, partial [Bryobacterales bacterium]|nr:hypothetical protein [Bryobacterales bacterium]